MESRTLKEILGITEDKPKTPRTVESPLELLELVMYGNREIGEVDQAYEDLKSYLKEVKE